MESGGAEKGQSEAPAPAVEDVAALKFRALFAYAGQHEDELSFQVGDLPDQLLRGLERLIG